MFLSPSNVNDKIFTKVQKKIIFYKVKACFFYIVAYFSLFRGKEHGDFASGH